MLEPSRSSISRTLLSARMHEAAWANIPFCFRAAADISLNKGHDLRNDFVVLHYPNRGNSQTLLPNVASTSVVASRSSASNVGPVGKRNRECHQLSLIEYRPNGLDIGKMISANKGVVYNPNIPFFACSCDQRAQEEPLR